MSRKVVQSVILASILVATAAFASTPPVSSEAAPILMWVIGGLCTLLCTITAFILNKVDRNQTRLFELRDSDHERLVRLETKCDGNHSAGKK